MESRSVAYSSASRSFGSSSSRFLALSGFVLIVMLVTSDVGTDCTSKRESFLSELIALNGTWSAKSMLPESRSAIIRSEEHTSELQSHVKLVCRLLLEKKNDMRQPRVGLHVAHLLVGLYY